MRFTVSAATGNEREAVCRLLASVRPPMDQARSARRYCELFASGELDSAGLFAAHDETGVIRGAMLVQVMPGALGLAWPPLASLRRHRRAIEDALVAAAEGWLRGRGIKVCQAFASALDRDSARPLLRHGFRAVTQLIDFTCQVCSLLVPDSRLQFERVGPANCAAFAAAMLATYAGSLDCPEAAGARTEAELLEGIADPKATKEHWFLAAREGKPAGVVLLDREAEAGGFDLTYLGLMPSFRGQGHGREMLQFALNHVRNEGGRTLAVSVDARNTPALHLYRTLDFQACGTRTVFLAEWPAIS
jgi:mycothiol synthase